MSKDLHSPIYTKLAPFSSRKNLKIVNGDGFVQAAQTPLFELPGGILGKEMGSTGARIMDGWPCVHASPAGAFLGSILDNYGLTQGLMVMAIVSVV